MRCQWRQQRRNVLFWYALLFILSWFSIVEKSIVFSPCRLSGVAKEPPMYDDICLCLLYWHHVKWKLAWMAPVSRLLAAIVFLDKRQKGYNGYLLCVRRTVMNEPSLSSIWRRSSFNWMIQSNPWIFFQMPTKKLSISLSICSFALFLSSFTFYLFRKPHSSLSS
jgi:hypothetical protein